jgi:hypothetical protein
MGGQLTIEIARWEGSATAIVLPLGALVGGRA